MNFSKKLLCSASAVAVSAFLAIPVMAAGAQWKRNDRGWWYEEANGAYPTNQWKLINNKWYYFDNIGYMAENRWVGNYFVGSDGAMLVSTSTPDGYYVDATGKWVEGIKKTVNIGKKSSQRSSGGSSSSGRSRGSSKRSGGGGSSSRGSSGGSSGGGSVGSTSSGSVATNTNNTAGGNTTANTSGGNHQVVTPVNNTNNTATTVNNQVSSEETRVVEALKAMGVSEKEAELYYIINAYRESLGLQKLSFSKSLTIVARTHVADSNAYTPENMSDSRGIKGNLHSWSNHGSWTPVVYTSDHQYAANMWSKPRELTSYTGDGYEISSYASGNITPEGALDLWKHSSAHNQVMTTQGSWSDLKTMGVAIDGNYAHVWFGSAGDPAGYYDVANYQVLHP